MTYLCWFVQDVCIANIFPLSRKCNRLQRKKQQQQNCICEVFLPSCSNLWNAISRMKDDKKWFLIVKNKGQVCVKLLIFLCWWFNYRRIHSLKLIQHSIKHVIIRYQLWNILSINLSLLSISLVNVQISWSGSKTQMDNLIISMCNVRVLIKKWIQQKSHIT